MRIEAEVEEGEYVLIERSEIGRLVTWVQQHELWSSFQELAVQSRLVTPSEPDPKVVAEKLSAAQIKALEFLNLEAAEFAPDRNIPKRWKKVTFDILLKLDLADALNGEKFWITDFGQAVRGELPEVMVEEARQAVVRELSK